MKGIILAGGAGTRLHPLTKVVSKQLLPVYDKPMIYYPLSTLMLSGIREVLIISTPHDLPQFERLLGDGSQLGMQLSYKVQPSPDGLAQAFILGEEFIGKDNVCLVLGDNIFYGAGLPNMLRSAVKVVEDKGMAQIFGYYVNDPERYGVAEIDEDNNVLSIEEKPEHPKSPYAVVMGRGYAWLDTGTHEALSEATEFVKTIEKRTSLKISCIEEIAWRMGFIDDMQLAQLAEDLGKSGYRKYLDKFLDR